MRQDLELKLRAKLATVAALSEVDLNDLNYTLTWSKHLDHGHFACNIALLLAKVLKQKPKDIASSLQSHVLEIDIVAQVDVAGPGFLNITLRADRLLNVVTSTINLGANYSVADLGKGLTVNLEYVSANPTGPLHVGHGRGAALGSALANILSVSGYIVHQEYYVNDAGRQIKILGLSCLVRVLHQDYSKIKLPEGCYQGDYLDDIAQAYIKQFAINFPVNLIELFNNFIGDDVDHLIAAVVDIIGADKFLEICNFTADFVLADIKSDLDDFGVRPNWFTETSLVANGQVEALLADLRQVGAVYEQDGAVWFKASEFGDEKDRVLIRANGNMTYFAADAAYHRFKLERFDQAIDIWGADHHGYVARIRAVLMALGADASRFSCLLVQFVNLVESGKKVAMSTRAGTFVTLKQLLKDIGVDVCRFFYLMRRFDQHMDFDLSLARTSSQENPVYYVQYANARINSILRQAEVDIKVLQQVEISLDKMGESAESLVLCLAQYPDIIISCTVNKEVYGLVNYLQQLAAGLHRYYNSETCLVSDLSMRNARLSLLYSVQLVLQQGLALLGVSAPETM